PILCIPVEITPEIFIHCLPHEPKPSPLIAPMLLTAICQKWRYIARGDPRLWSVLQIDVRHGHCPPGDQYRLNIFVREWLLRAWNMPMSVHIELPTQHQRRYLDSFPRRYEYDINPALCHPRFSPIPETT
ncbi:hypothetical protein DFH07DRAFT_753446, partial [Mycena maculata]